MFDKSGHGAVPSKVTLGAGYDEADAVVVGGGTAGAIVAARLAEEPETSVILIEAGPSDEGNPIVRELRRSAELLGGELDYDYPIEPQRLGNSRIRQSRGRMLGGCSAHNTGIAFVTPDHDLREWERRGAVGLGPEQARPLFERVLDRVHIERASDANHCARAFVDAALQAGYPLAEFDGGSAGEGVGWFWLNVSHGARQSSSACYLHPLAGLPTNLRVITDCVATRILLDDSGVARAVETSRGRIGARHEVIVCCGAFDSPRLLLLSGIGPRDHLADMGIDVVHELPAVGEHLVDHPDAVVLFDASRPVSRPASQGWETGLFARSHRDLDVPDVMFHFGTVPYDLNTSPAGYPTTEVGFSINPNVMRPWSEGVVRLRSADPFDPPLIDPRYFADESGRDRELMIWGLEEARRLASQPALHDWVRAELAPGPGMTDLKRYIAETSGTVYHPVGTCRLGGQVDEDAVVDANLRVRGLGHLRVADSSVFPTMPGVNPCLTVMLVAERCADLVRSQVP